MKGDWDAYSGLQRRRSHHDYRYQRAIRVMRGNPILKLVDRWAGILLLGMIGALRAIGRAGRSPEPAALRTGDQVLVIKQSALGDTLLLLPVLKALRDRTGSTGRIVMIATAVNREVAEACPWVDEVRLLDPGRAVRNPLSLVGFARRLRRDRFDVVLDFDQWLRSSALLAVVSGATFKLGFRTPGQHRHFGYDTVVDQTPGHHEFTLFSRLAETLGIATSDIEPYPGFLRRHGIWNDSDPGQDVMPGTRGDASARGPRVILHPGCGAHGWQRAWPLEHFADLGALLWKHHGADLSVTGHGAHEVSLARELEQKGRFPLANLAGQLSFGQLAGHLRRSDLVVCGNTGIMHLAAGLDVPMVALHGPTDPGKWGPHYGSDPAARPQFQLVAAALPCSPCLFLGFEYGCPKRPCMESLTPHAALEAARLALGAGRATTRPAIPEVS